MNAPVSPLAPSNRVDAVQPGTDPAHRQASLGLELAAPALAEQLPQADAHRSLPAADWIRSAMAFWLADDGALVRMRDGHCQEAR